MRILLSAVIVIFFGRLNAQNSIVGRITDMRDSTALIGATLYISDLKRGAATNLEGRYVLENLPAGHFLVEVRYAGYETQVVVVRVQGRTVFNVALNPAVTELNEVVVTGISHSTELKRSPIPITTLGAEALAERPATNLMDKIAGHPGISQITTGTGISKPVVRGLGFNRVITLYDGIRQEGQQWGDEHGVEIDEFSVNRVEIIKGAGSLMYGSDGLGGIVNFLAPDPLPEGEVAGKWISNYQSNNGLIANSISLAGNNAGIYWLGRASQKNARAYRNRYDGRVFNSGFREFDLNGTLGITDDWGFTQVSVSSFNQKLGMTEGNRDASGNFVRDVFTGQDVEEIKVSPEDLRGYSLFVPYQRVRHFRVTSNTNYYRGNSRVRLNVGYQRNVRREYGNAADSNEQELGFDLHSTTLNLVYFFPARNDLRISAGTSGMFQKSVASGEEFLIPDYHFFDWGVFAFAKWHYNTVDIAGGIRYDQRIMNITPLFLDADDHPSDYPGDFQKFWGGSPAFSNFSASLGVTEVISPDVTVKFNLSKGFRAPTVAELAANGSHEGSLQYEYGNPALEAETSLQMDLGLTLQSEHVTVEAALFRNLIDHYIYLQKLRGRDGTDSIPNPDDPLPAYRYSQGDARLAGGELTVDIHPHPFDWLHFENTLSGVHGINRRERDNDSSRYLPFIPAVTYRGQLRANLNGIGGRLQDAFFMIEFRHVWEQSRVHLENGTETPTPAYSLWNAAVGTGIRKKHGTTPLLTVYLSANNIFDIAYQDHLSRLKYAPENPATLRRGIFNMGRNFSIKVVVPLSVREKNNGRR